MSSRLCFIWSLLLNTILKAIHISKSHSIVKVSESTGDLFNPPAIIDQVTFPYTFPIPYEIGVVLSIFWRIKGYPTNATTPHRRKHDIESCLWRLNKVLYT